MKVNKEDSYAKLNYLQRVVVWSIFLFSMIVLDMIIAGVLILPFALIYHVWSYWVNLLIVIVVLQLVTALLIYRHSKNKGGN